MFLDPCTVSSCGSCAECTVSNHKAFCSCPAEMTGNPAASCAAVLRRCDAGGRCPAGSSCDGGICLASCSSSSNCGCGSACVEGVCRQQCTAGLACPQVHK